MWVNSHLGYKWSLNVEFLKVRRKNLYSVNAASSSNYGATHDGITLRSMIHAVVQSQEFRSK